MPKAKNKEVLSKEAIEAEVVEETTEATEETTESDKSWNELEVSEKEAIEAVRGSRVSCIATGNLGSFKKGQRYELSPQVYKRYQSILELVQ